MGGRANLRLARPLPKTRQRFREPDKDRARLRQARLNPIYAEKALSNRINLLDGLLGCIIDEPTKAVAP